MGGYINIYEKYGTGMDFKLLSKEWNFIKQFYKVSKIE